MKADPSCLMTMMMMMMHDDARDDELTTPMARSLLTTSRDLMQHHQNAFAEAEELVVLSDTLNKIIPDTARIVYAFDNTPNTALYLLKKRGVRIAKDFNPELTADILAKSRARFLVFNDSALWFSRYEPQLKTGARAVYHQKNTHVFQLP